MMHITCVFVVNNQQEFTLFRFFNFFPLISVQTEYCEKTQMAKLLRRVLIIEYISVKIGLF